MPASEMIERSEDDKVEDLKTATSGMDADLQEWCLLPEVSLPFAHLDASDGRGAQETFSIQALDQESFVQGLSCRGSPRRIHRRIRDVDKAIHVLDIDIAGPLTKSDDGYVLFSTWCIETPRFSSLD